MSEEYKKILESIEDAVLVTRNGIIKYANHSALDLLTGEGKKEVLERNIFDFIKEDWRDFVGTKHEKAKKGEKSHSFEIMIERTDGKVIPGEATAQMMDYKGSKAELFAIRNIESRKKTEEVFWKQEERFRAVAENTPDIIARFDEEGRYVYVNKAAEELYGIPEKEFFWKTDEDLGINKERSEAFHDAIRYVFQNHEKKTFYSEDTINGERRYFYTILVPEFLEDGTMNSALSITRDITEIREIDEVKSEFISTATHQLRSPLSAINWCTLSLLREEAGEVNEEQKDYLEQIEGATKNLIKITDAFLNTTMLDLEMFVFNPKRVDVVETTEKVKKEFEEMAKKKEIDFSADYDDFSSFIKIDPRVLKMILRGLISNALEYTPERGSVDLLVRKKDKDRVVIEVSDDGCGVPPESKEKIFSKFYRTKEARKQKAYGTGLDLYLIKSLLDKVSGSIELDSPNPRYGKGAVFYVEFPTCWEEI